MGFADLTTSSGLASELAPFKANHPIFIPALTSAQLWSGGSRLVRTLRGKCLPGSELSPLPVPRQTLHFPHLIY